MKLAVFVLIVLGLLAATSAAFLFQVLHVPGRQTNSDDDSVEVVVAQSDLEARTCLKEEHLVLQAVPKKGLAADCFAAKAQAIGKILKVAVTKGELITGSVCTVKGGVDDLLKPGMLAFAAPFPRDSSVFELLYPGCVVDVFATFPLQKRTKGEAVVFPLLQSVQVLAVGTDTVVAPTEEGKAGAAAKARGIAIVTLAVNARQVGALQLALKQGTLGLAMRSPTDKEWHRMEPMVVKEGQLTAASETLDPQELSLINRIQQMLKPDESEVDPNALPTPSVAKAGTPSDPNAPHPTAAIASGPLPEFVGSSTVRRSWQMTIIRGQKVDQEEIAGLAEQVEPPAEPNKEEAVPQEKSGQ